MRPLVILSGVIAFAVFVCPARTFGSPDPAARQEIAAPVAQTRSMTRLACSFEDCKAQCYYGEGGQLLPRAQRNECMRVCRRRQEGADAFKGKAKIESFLRNRSTIERLARAKYLTWPVEEPESVLVRTGDVSKPRKANPGEALRRPRLFEQIFRVDKWSVCRG